MRNPGENSEARVEGETTSQACAREFERDDCASPPCKRLKQAVLHFSALSSSPSTFPVSSNSSISPQNIGSCDTSSEISKPTQTCEEKPRINGGLVTGAPSPPDVKEGSSKSQPIPDPAKVSKSLNLENGMKTATGQDMSSVASPEAKSGSHMEDELMVVDQSPPPKINDNKVISGTPLLKSAEKQKRKEERERERQEKQRLREEKLKEKQEAKAMKEKERLVAKRKREQEKQEKQAEKERKEKERAEKREQEERERMEKKAKRDEEKRKRDEEKNAKMEEKRKREAEKRSIEEEQVRKRQKIQQQQQEIFSNFFTKTSAVVPKVVTENNSRFKPFEIKAGMSLAPVIRKRLTSDTQRALDDGLQQQEFSELYLRELERRKPIPKYTKRKLTAIPEHAESNSDATMLIDIDENSNSSIEIIEPKKMVEKKKWKLLQFHQNYRPAYFGTWRKKSRKISPKNPFKKDTELLDYEVDSDDEWEEEEPGESLSDSEGEDEADDNEELNEDDDGFFVPHGYLSDDEGVEDEDVEGDSGENDEKEDNPENKKDQQLAKAKAWEAEMKRKCKPVKPIAVGCLWLEEASLNLTLKRFAACLLVDEPIDVQSSSTNSRNTEIPVDSLSSNNSGALYVPNEAMPDLIKLIHGNTAGLHKIMGHFRKQWTAKCLGGDVTDEEIEQKCPISKRQLEKKIQNIATKERRTDRLRWYVHNHVLASFHLENLVVADGLSSSDASSDATMATVTQNTNTPSIMQFVRPVSPATHRDTSVGVKHNTAKIEPFSAPCDSSTPMEVDSTSPSLNHCQPTQVSGSSSAENSQLHVENNLTLTKGINSQICNPTSITAVITTKKTEANTILEPSSGKLIETVCVD